MITITSAFPILCNWNEGNYGPDKIITAFKINRNDSSRKLSANKSPNSEKCIKGTQTLYNIIVLKFKL